MPPARRFDAVLFDFGGVLTSSPFERLRSHGSSTGVGAEAAVAVFMGPDQDTDHPWHRVERGELALQDALKLIAADAEAIGMSLDPAGLGSFFGESIVQDRVIGVIRELRLEGLLTALVTNNARELASYWRPMIPLDELFDVVVDSSEVGIRKPDPRIYQLTLNRLGGVDPRRAVFLDDLAINVTAAVELGLAGIVVTDHDKALAELDQLLHTG